MNGLKKLRTIVVVAACIPLLAAAQNWQLGIGVSYRDFDDVDFDAIRKLQVRNLRLLLDADEAMEYSDALIEDIQAGWVQIVDVDSFAIGYRGSSESIDSSDSFAPVISAETPLWAEENLTLNFVANLQWYNVDVSNSARFGVAADAREYQYWVQNGVLAPRPTFPQRDGAPYGDVMVTGRASSSFEMDLYEVDLGLKLLYSIQNYLDCFVAAGPTLSIVDMESSVRETVYWSAPGDSGMLARQRNSDSDTDFIFGGYVSAGGEYWFNEQYGVSLEARYDATLDDAELDGASVDLDGFSGQAKFMMRF
jgi:hypothetical protein